MLFSKTKFWERQLPGRFPGEGESTENGCPGWRRKQGSLANRTGAKGAWPGGGGMTDNGGPRTEVREGRPENGGPRTEARERIPLVFKNIVFRKAFGQRTPSGLLRKVFCQEVANRTGTKGAWPGGGGMPEKGGPRTEVRERRPEDGGPRTDSPRFEKHSVS